MPNFGIVRLGAQSIENINEITGANGGVQRPALNIEVGCKQVSTQVVSGTRVLIWLGSDNNKGKSTLWKQGLRALGTLTAKEGGPKYEDAWTLKIDIRVVFPESIGKPDFVAQKEADYASFMQMPIVGVVDNASQTVRMIDPSAGNQSISGLFSSLVKIQPCLRDYILAVYPDMEQMLEHSPQPSSQCDTGRMQATLRNADDPAAYMVFMDEAPSGEETRLELEDDFAPDTTLIFLSRTTGYCIDTIWRVVESRVMDNGKAEVLVSRELHSPDNAISANRLLSGGFIGTVAAKELRSRIEVIGK